MRDRREQGHVLPAQHHRRVLKGVLRAVERILPALDDLEHAGESRQGRDLGPASTRTPGAGARASLPAAMVNVTSFMLLLIIHLGNLEEDPCASSPKTT